MPGEKEELRKRRSIYGPPPCSLMPPAPGIERKFRRWNVVLIAILVFLVLGIFVIAKAPAPSTAAYGAANTSLKAGRAAGSAASHAKSKSARPQTHNHT